MAISNTTNWRIRAGGLDTNGGGFDPSVSGALSTTLNGSISSGTTSIVVTSATGWPGSGNYYARIGNTGAETFSSGSTGSSEIVLVTGGQGTTTWTVTRGQLGTVAQAFATGVVVDNDQSRGNTATQSGTVGTAAGTTTFSDVAATFDLTCVGNVINIASGAGFTAGFYCIQSRTNATTVVLDRSPGTGTVAVWKMAGAWKTIIGNSASTQIQPGNKIYIRAGGSGSLASPDYTETNLVTPPGGDTTNGFIYFIGENGRPYCKSASISVIWYNWSGYLCFENLYTICGGNSNAPFSVITPINGYWQATNVTMDQNGFDVDCFRNAYAIYGCEALSSTANSGTAGNGSGWAAPSLGAGAFGCNFHDLWGVGATLTTGDVLSNCIISKSRGNAINISAASSCFVINCTIDSPVGHGISIANATTLVLTTILGCIISNCSGASKFGISCNFGSTATNDRLRGWINFNSYFNNTGNAQNLTVGSTTVNSVLLQDNIGVDPQYGSVSTENYAIGTNLAAVGFPRNAFVQSLSVKTTTVISYMDAGGVQRQATSGSAGPLIGGW